LRIEGLKLPPRFRRIAAFAGYPKVTRPRGARQPSASLPASFVFEFAREAFVSLGLAESLIGNSFEVFFETPWLPFEGSWLLFTVIVTSVVALPQKADRRIRPKADLNGSVTSCTVVGFARLAADVYGITTDLSAMGCKSARRNHPVTLLH